MIVPPHEEVAKDGTNSNDNNTWKEVWVNPNMAQQLLNLRRELEEMRKENRELRIQGNKHNNERPEYSGNWGWKGDEVDCDIEEHQRLKEEEDRPQVMPQNVWIDIPPTRLERAAPCMTMNNCLKKANCGKHLYDMNNCLKKGNCKEPVFKPWKTKPRKMIRARPSTTLTEIVSSSWYPFS